MPWCAVAGCSANEKQSDDVSFHRFPKEVTIKNAWVNSCKRADFFRTDTARVCSKHFEAEDYERDLKSELLNIKTKKKLKTSAVPHLNIPTSKEIPKTKHERDQRAKSRNNKKIVDSLVSFSQPQIDRCNDVNENVENAIVYHNEGSSVQEMHIPEETVTSEVTELTSENILLKQKIAELTQELENCKREINTLRDNLGKYESRFTDCQKKVITRGKCSNWSSGDVSKAITLRCLSRKALNFVRDTLNYPFPSEVTVKRRLSQVTVIPGFINISFDILKAHVAVFTDFEKNVILSFDEMRVKSEMCYDTIDDRIVGPHKNVQVLVIRSLVGKWRQPVYYNFDKSVDQSLLSDVINEVEAAGFQVRGIVSDLGGSNRKLLSDLKVNINRVSFTNPYSNDRKVWTFSDVPHMLKLLRNHLLDQGYVLKSGKYVTKAIFETLINSQQGDLKLAHKVNQSHILVAGTERQNVRKAAELLSGTVAAAIRYLHPEESHTADFIDTINNGFDVLNSRTPTHQNNLKGAYGTHLIEQDEALNKLYDLIFSMRVIGRKELLPFQVGFLTSIRSLQGLYTDLKQDGYRYIMSARCNQDILESYFSLLRGLGRFYDHPSPAAVTQRIKSLLLSSSASSVIKGKNCGNDDNDGNDSCVLSAEVIKEGLSDNTNEAQDINEAMDDTGSFDNNDDDHSEEQITAQLDETESVTNSEINTDSRDLLQMLAGYIAYRVKKKKLNSKFEYGYPTGLYPSNKPDWLTTVSKGALMNPTPEWLNVVFEMEQDFNKYHGLESLNKDRGVMKHVIKMLTQKHTQVDEFAIACFVRTRTFIRMKSMNKKTALKRKTYGNKTNDSSRKISKKVNKLQ